MKKIRLHLWFALNLAMLGLVFYNRGLLYIPLFLEPFFSFFLLKSREEMEEIKKKYINSRENVLTLLGSFLLFIFLTGSSDFTQGSNCFFSIHSWLFYAFFFVITCHVLATYIKLLLKKDD